MSFFGGEGGVYASKRFHLILKLRKGMIKLISHSELSRFLIWGEEERKQEL